VTNSFFGEKKKLKSAFTFLEMHSHNNRTLNKINLHRNEELLHGTMDESCAVNVGQLKVVQ